MPSPSSSARSATCEPGSRSSPCPERPSTHPAGSSCWIRWTASSSSWTPSADRIEENIASLEELRAALASYGRALEEIPLVVQYNKRDQSDPYALEELHRKLSMRSVAAFEAVATSGTGVLQTLTTISKRVIRHLRKRNAADPASAPLAESASDRAGAEPTPPLGTSQILETAYTSADDSDSPRRRTARRQRRRRSSAPLRRGSPRWGGHRSHGHGDRSSLRALLPAGHGGAGGSGPAGPRSRTAQRRWRRSASSRSARSSQTASGAVRIPILLRDEAGRSLAISLTRGDRSDQDGDW